MDDKRLRIKGTGITQHPLLSPRSYTKTAAVLAAQAGMAGEVETPEGVMAFEKDDYIVSDDPPTHAWPVKREVFESTHEEFG